MGYKFLRPCLVCGTLAKATYCATHQAEVNARKQQAKDTPERLARKRALYGGDYRRRRQAVLAVATHCGICNKEFLPDDAIDVDHITPGDPRSPLQAAHAFCNRSKGARA